MSLKMQFIKLPALMPGEGLLLIHNVTRNKNGFKSMEHLQESKVLSYRSMISYVHNMSGGNALLTMNSV